MIQDPNVVTLKAGDKVLLCLAEEPSAAAADQMAEQLDGYLEGVTVALIGGVRAVVVQRGEAAADES